MAHMVICVVDQMDRCPDLLSAWTEAGAAGSTIVESSGPGRQGRVAMDDLPLFPSLRDLAASGELHHRTLFTVVPDEETVDRVIAATEATLGDLSRHHTGILFVVPVTRALGLNKVGADAGPVS